MWITTVIMFTVSATHYGVAWAFLAASREADQINIDNDLNTWVGRTDLRQEISKPLALETRLFVPLLFLPSINVGPPPDQ